MSKKFNVIVDFESRHIEVEAKNIDEAKKKVHQMYEEGDVYSEACWIAEVEDGEGKPIHSCYEYLSGIQIYP